MFSYSAISFLSSFALFLLPNDFLFFFHVYTYKCSSDRTTARGVLYFTFAKYYRFFFLCACLWHASDCLRCRDTKAELTWSSALHARDSLILFFFFPSLFGIPVVPLFRTAHIYSNFIY